MPTNGKGKRVYVPQIGETIVFPEEMTFADMDSIIRTQAIPSLGFHSGKSLLNLLSTSTKLYEGQATEDVRDDLTDMSAELARGIERMKGVKNFPLIQKALYSPYDPENEKYQLTPEEQEELLVTKAENQDAFEQMQNASTRRLLVLQQLQESPYFKGMSIAELDEKFENALHPAMATAFHAEPAPRTAVTRTFRDATTEGRSIAAALEAGAPEDESAAGWLWRKAKQGAFLTGASLTEGAGKMSTAMEQMLVDPRTGKTPQNLFEGLANIGLRVNTGQGIIKEGLRFGEGALQVGFGLIPEVMALSTAAPAAIPPIKATIHALYPSMRDDTADRLAEAAYNVGTGFGAFGKTVGYGLSASLATNFLGEMVQDKVLDMQDSEEFTMARGLLGDLAFFATAGAHGKYLKDKADTALKTETDAKKAAAAKARAEMIEKGEASFTKRLDSIEKTFLELKGKNEAAANNLYYKILAGAEKYPQYKRIAERLKPHVTERPALPEARPAAPSPAGSNLPGGRPVPTPPSRVIEVGPGGQARSPDIVLDNLASSLIAAGKQFPGMEKLGNYIQKNRAKFPGGRLPVSVEPGTSHVGLTKHLAIREELRALMAEHGKEIAEYDAITGENITGLVTEALGTGIAKEIPRSRRKAKAAKVVGLATGPRAEKIAEDLSKGVILDKVDEMFRKEHEADIDRLHIEKTGRSHITGIDALVDRMEKSMGKNKPLSAKDQQAYLDHPESVEALLDYRSKTGDKELSEVYGQLSTLRLDALAMKMFGKKFDDLSGAETTAVRYASAGKENPYAGSPGEKAPIKTLPTSGKEELPSEEGTPPQPKGKKKPK